MAGIDRESFAVAEHAVGVGLSGLRATGWESSLSVSTGGVIAYRTSSAGATRQFVWFDRSGKPLAQVGDAVRTNLWMPSLSRDGERVALYRAVNGNVDIWWLEAKRGGFSRFTTDPADDVMPVWSPNGDRIAFSSNRKGVHDVYQKSTANGGSEELLLSTAEPKQVTDWSADGRFLLINSQNRERSGDIWALPLEAHAKAFPVVQTMFDELRGQFSPDVHWIAFQSNESGRAEIYVQPFPGSQIPIRQRWQSSTLATRWKGVVLRRAGWPTHGSALSRRPEHPDSPSGRPGRDVPSAARLRGAAG